jgi:hypothetical protein
MSISLTSTSSSAGAGQQRRRQHLSQSMAALGAWAEKGRTPWGRRIRASAHDSKTARPLGQTELVRIQYGAPVSRSTWQQKTPSASDHGARFRDWRAYLRAFSVARTITRWRSSTSDGCDDRRVDCNGPVPNISLPKVTPLWHNETHDLAPAVRWGFCLRW